MRRPFGRRFHVVRRAASCSVRRPCTTSLGTSEVTKACPMPRALKSPTRQWILACSISLHRKAMRARARPINCSLRAPSLRIPMASSRSGRRSVISTSLAGFSRTRFGRYQLNTAFPGAQFFQPSLHQGHLAVPADQRRGDAQATCRGRAVLVCADPDQVVNFDRLFDSLE